MYEAKKNIDKLKNGEPTLFLDPNLEKEITKKFKNDINVFRPYKEAERIIIYRDLKPKISLFKIITKEKLRHQDIMGSILSLNIKKEVLGDIIVDDNNYYFYILESMNNYILSYFNKVKNINITLEELPLNYLKDYKRKYKEIIVNVKSNRVDLIISKLTGLSRKVVKDMISNKDIILNYQVLTNNSYQFKENDIFSIRGYGKYKYVEVINKTKKNNYLVKCLKYI